MPIDYKDFNTRWKGHKKYRSNKVIEEDIIEVVIQKLEMLLFTNKGDVFGENNIDFGGDLEFYLWQTNISNANLKNNIIEQINQYIPELFVMGFDLELNFIDNGVMDTLELNFKIKGYNVSFLIQ